MRRMTTNDLSAWLGKLSLTGLCLFALTCISIQFLRPDLDWVDVPLSFYLLGEWGDWLRVAYFVMAVALVLLAGGMYLSFAHHPRSAAPLLLFVLAALGLCITAVEDTRTWQHPNTWSGLVHGIAAQATFLCVTVAMILQGWWVHRNPAWAGRFRSALVWSLVCFAALWVQVLWRDLPRGWSQKLLVLMILAWLGKLAWQLGRGPASLEAKQGRAAARHHVRAGNRSDR